MNYNKIKIQASLGELRAIETFIRKGYEIFKQYTGKESIDFIALKDDKIYRIEVKSTSIFRHGIWKVGLRKTRNNAKGQRVFKFNDYKDNFDLLVVYIYPKDAILIYHKDEITDQCELSITNEEIEVKKHDEFLKYEISNINVEEE
jgi:Holliday junction resolvase-like predicted endonuclease